MNLSSIHFGPLPHPLVSQCYNWIYHSPTLCSHGTVRYCKTWLSTRVQPQFTIGSSWTQVRAKVVYQVPSRMIKILERIHTHTLDRQVDGKTYLGKISFLTIKNIKDNLFFLETLILELLKKAPEPFSAKKISFLIGSNIKPQTTSPFSS